MIKLEDMEPLSGLSRSEELLACLFLQMGSDGAFRSTPSTTTDEVVVSHEEVTPMCRHTAVVSCRQLFLFFANFSGLAISPLCLRLVVEPV